MPATATIACVPVRTWREKAILASVIGVAVDSESHEKWAAGPRDHLEDETRPHGSWRRTTAKFSAEGCMRRCCTRSTPSPPLTTPYWSFQAV